MEQGSQSMSPPRAGLIGGALAIGKNLLGLLLCRLELAALELSEVRAAVLKMAVLFGLGLITAAFALACWTGLVVVLAWDSLGWKILAIVAAFFTVATLALVWYARAMIEQGKLSLPATMAELRTDRDALL
ncbi:MAG: phage holin family protein [Burkholderiales bacterium]|nr:phage holin family protein [Burkholderiales bacterium]